MKSTPTRLPWMFSAEMWQDEHNLGRLCWQQESWRKTYRPQQVHSFTKAETSNQFKIKYLSPWSGNPFGKCRDKHQDFLNLKFIPYQFLCVWFVSLTANFSLDPPPPPAEHGASCFRIMVKGNFISQLDWTKRCSYGCWLLFLAMRACDGVGQQVSTWTSGMIEEEPLTSVSRCHPKG